jgi:hypothetical protein
MLTFAQSVAISSSVTLRLQLHAQYTRHELHFFKVKIDTV